MIALIDSRLDGIRTEAGEPIVDLIDAVAQEQERTGTLIEYVRLSNSSAGWRELLADQSFLDDLAAALGVSRQTLDPKLARAMSAPSSITNDLDVILWFDLGRYAESLGRSRRAATYATTTLRIYVASNAPVVLLRGASIKSSSGVLYETTADLVGVVPALDLEANKYFVETSAQAKQPGRIGNAIQGAIRDIVSGFQIATSVSNSTAAEGGQDAESNDALLSGLEETSGRDILTKNGLRNFFLAQAGVEDAVVIGPGDSLMERAAGGAVDVYVIGATLLTASSVVRVLVDGDVVVLPLQPVRTISSVTAGSPLSEGNSFVSTMDTGVYRGSARARTQIAFNTVANGGPAVSTDVTIVYTYNDLVRDLQALIDNDPDRNVPSSSILVKEATRNGITVEVKVVPYPGVQQATAETAVQTALLNLIDAKKLGEDLDYSDAYIAAGDAEVDGVKVVDRIDSFRIGLSSSTLGTSNLTVPDNAYVRLDTVTFLV